MAKRKKQNVEIIIVNRDEPLLEWTIQNIRRTTKGVKITVVNDGLPGREYNLDNDINIFNASPVPVGVSYCRDRGIMQSDADYIVLFDAHMSMDDKWLDVMLKDLQEDERRIVCSKSKVVYNNNREKVLRIRSGARMKMGIGQLPLEPEWVDCAPGVIPLVLGGCYALSRQRYIDIGRPWANAVGWGSSEPVLSLVNWMFGGECYLSDCATTHVYRDNNDQPYRIDNHFKIGNTYNRLRAINLLNSEKTIELQRLYLNRACSNKQIYNEAVEMYKKAKVYDDQLIAKYERTFEDWKQTFYPKLNLERCVR